MISTYVWSDGIDRGASAPVGLILIMGFVVLVGVGTMIFAQGVINVEDPKADADFTLETKNKSEGLVGQLVYARGSEFTADNTEKLYIVGQTSDGAELNGSSGIVLYEDGNADYKTDENSTIQKNDVVISTETTDGEDRLLFNSGTAAQVVWVPEGEDQEKIVDEFAVPDESTILQRTQAGGNFIETDIGITIG